VDGELKLEEVKTDDSRATLPVPRPLLAILREHRKRQMEERFEAGNQWRESGLVFTTKLGRPIEPRNANRMFHRLCEQAGVRQVRVQDLRHSCATLLFTQGVDAATVQKILRHSSTSVTTGIYLEVVEAVKRDALVDGQPVRLGRRQRWVNCRQRCRQPGIEQSVGQQEGQARNRRTWPFAWVELRGLEPLTPTKRFMRLIGPARHRRSAPTPTIAAAIATEVAPPARL
jgi:hypothetical protein